MRCSAACSAAKLIFKGIGQRFAEAIGTAIVKPQIDKIEGRITDVIAKGTASADGQANAAWLVSGVADVG